MALLEPLLCCHSKDFHARVSSALLWTQYKQEEVYGELTHPLPRLVPHHHHHREQTYPHL
jgi:hypothetical protein